MPVLPSDCDVLVLGSGCAAMAAALHASSHGLRVVVCEKSTLLGGTSAMSAGAIWIPNNHLAREAGIEDSAEDALRYIEAASPEHIREPAQWRAMVEAGPKLLRLLEAKTPLRFKLTGEPDPYSDAPGARSRGRMCSPLPLSRWKAGRFAFKVRGSTLPEIYTYHEVLETDLYHKPLSTTLHLLPRLMPRLLTLSAGKGTALMLGLVRGCLDAGCHLATQASGRRLRLESGRVVGAEIDTPQGMQFVRARHTLIATGGFEWNPELMQQHFPGALQFFGSPTSNEGDAVRLAQEAGAALGHMSEANITPAIPKPYRGDVHGMPVPYHAEPNTIVVNRHGDRFVDELTMNIGDVLNARDADNQPLHLPAYVITDASYLPRAPLVRYFARYAPGWMVKADSLAELARKIDVPASRLEASVARYNSFSATGQDLDFGRGKTRAHQQADKRKKLGLAPIVRAPYIAIAFNRSIMSTKGGPRTNAAGQVVRGDGTVIEGLYCAGAAMANPIGTRGLGAGTTLGPFMAWGYVCAEHMRAAHGSTP